MAAADATVPHTGPGAGAGALRFTSILLATLLAFKVVPGTVISDDTFAGQTDEDWSAIYAQFSVRHAVNYLGNHNDRGHSVASLVAITTRRELPLCMCGSAASRDGGIDGAAKAAMLLRALAEEGQSLGEGPLMNLFENLHLAPWPSGGGPAGSWSPMMRRSLSVCCHTSW